MKAFRSYEVEWKVGDKTRTWRFSETAGGLIPSEAPPEGTLLQERPIKPNTVEAEIRLRVFGDLGARRLAPATADPTHRLVQLFLGLAHIKAGIGLRGLDILDRLDRASELEIAVARDALDENERLNLLAEAMWSPWRHGSIPADHPLRVLAGLDGLDDESVNRRLRAWFEGSDTWSSRVVGFSHVRRRFVHKECGVEVSRVEAGDACWLVREHDNPADPQAVMVVHESGEKLGYLRRTIAAVVAGQIDRGAVFGATVCAFLSREFTLDERIYLRVDRAA